MTRPEYAGIRDLTFSKWIRNSLPDSSTGFLVSDLDFIIENWKHKRLMLVEVKTYSKPMSRGQDLLFQNIDRWIRNGIDEGWTYYGFHLVTFERSFFDDGAAFYDGEPVTEDELVNKLSLLTVDTE